MRGHKLHPTGRSYGLESRPIGGVFGASITKSAVRVDGPHLHETTGNSKHLVLELIPEGIALVNSRLCSGCMRYHVLDEKLA